MEASLFVETSLIENLKSPYVCTQLEICYEWDIEEYTEAHLGSEHTFFNINTKITKIYDVDNEKDIGFNKLPEELRREIEAQVDEHARAQSKLC